MKPNKKQNKTTNNTKPTTGLFNTDLFKNQPEYIEQLENKTNEAVSRTTKPVETLPDTSDIALILRGDTVTIKGQVCKVVEILEPNRWHVKNTQEPFNSFIITDADLEG